MKQSDIQAGRTYVGKDGVCRTVTRIEARGRKKYVVLKEETFRRGERLFKFAEWAESESKG